MRVRYLGGPSALIEYGGLRLLLDPTFDPPGTYEPRPGLRMTKHLPPPLSEAELPEIDIVLCSHDQHIDNLDSRGREIAAAAPLVVSTPEAAGRMGPPWRGAAQWERFDLSALETGVEITAAPARHGPPGAERVTGTVTGFFLRADAPPSVYVSGDNASLDLIAEIDGRLGPAEVSLLNCGGARAPDLLEGYITLTAESAVEAARGLRSDHIVPLHFEGWSHYSQDREDLRAAFAGTDVEAGLELLKPGETLALD